MKTIRVSAFWLTCFFLVGAYLSLDDSWSGYGWQLWVCLAITAAPFMAMKEGEIKR